jgi:hypothetical protein
MELTRRRMIDAFETGQETSPYDEMPVLIADHDPQLYLSRNTRPQPFFLICSRDTLLAQLSGSADVHLQYSPVRYHRLEPGDVVYIPAGTPSRIVPTTESLNLRYKARDAGLEGVAWFCEACTAEVYRSEFDTAVDLPQEGYWRACNDFNGNTELRRCPSCGAEHAEADLSGLRWPEVADAIRASD